MNEKRGELISLVWDCEPESYYIKGHVSDNEAIAALQAYYADDLNYTGARIDHVWAKWCRTTEDDGTPEGCEFAFRTRKEQRDGWFKVTEITLAEYQPRSTS